MTDAQKAATLRQAQAELESATQLIRYALGETDAADSTVASIFAAIEDLTYDIMELES